MFVGVLLQTRIYLSLNIEQKCSLPAGFAPLILLFPTIAKLPLAIQKHHNHKS